FFFSWDMASASRSIRKLENELETAHTKELVGASGASVTEPVERKQLVSDDMEYTDSVKRPAANIGVAILVVATLAHAFAVVGRAVAASRAPWGNLYEFMTSGALVITVVYLLFLLRKDLRFVGSFVTCVGLRTLIGASICLPTHAGHA